jgi:hypothetical protein
MKAAWFGITSATEEYDKLGRGRLFERSDRYGQILNNHGKLPLFLASSVKFLTLIIGALKALARNW